MGFLKTIVKGAAKLTEKEAAPAAKEGFSITQQAVRNAERNGTKVEDELIALDKQMQAKSEVSRAVAKPERAAAEANATSRSTDGVKTTTYPYAGPNEFKKGGRVTGFKGYGKAKKV